MPFNSTEISQRISRRKSVLFLCLRSGKGLLAELFQHWFYVERYASGTKPCRLVPFFHLRLGILQQFHHLRFELFYQFFHLIVVLMIVVFHFMARGISKDLTTQFASLSKMNQYSER